MTDQEVEMIDGEALPPVDASLAPGESARMQAMIVVGLFAGIAALVGVAVSLGVFEAKPAAEAQASKARKSNPEGVARAKALEAGEAASVKSLLGAQTDALLAQALDALPVPVAEAPEAEPEEEDKGQTREERSPKKRRKRPQPRDEGVRLAGKDAGRQGASVPPPKGYKVVKARKKSKGTGIKPASDPAGALGEARSRLGQGDPPSAIELFRSVLAAEPNNTRARLGLAQALYESGRITEARLEITRMLEAEPNHGRAILLMASIAQEQGPVSDAKIFYRRYLKLYPQGTSAAEVRSILARL